MFPMTKTDIAKSAVQMVIALNATKFTEQQVGQHTSLDTEAIPVKVGAMVAGQLIAHELRPVTDKAIDTVIKQVILLRLRKRLTK
jgi:hypothetical protein